MDLPDTPESSCGDTVLDNLASGFLVGAGRYTLTEIVGVSRSGPLWLAWDNQMQEKVAVKFLPPSLVLDAASFNEFRRSVQQIRKLTHFNFVRIFDLFSPPGEPAFLAMEFVDGMNLDQMRMNQPDQALSWDLLRPIAEQACSALAYAHSDGLAHGNLKPSNILIAGDGQIKLAHFGLNFGASSTAQDNFSYCSPQRLAGNAPAVSDDTYSLGAILYESLTGSPPFVADNIAYQIQNVLPQSISERLLEKGFQREVPEAVSAFILACLEKNADDRPPIASLIREISLNRAPSNPPALTPEEEAEAFARTLPKSPVEDQNYDLAMSPSGKISQTTILVVVAVVILLGLLALNWLRPPPPRAAEIPPAAKLAESNAPSLSKKQIPEESPTIPAKIPPKGTYVGEGPAFSYRYAPREAQDLDTNAINVGVRFSGEGAESAHCSYVCTSGTNSAGTITYNFRAAEGYMIEDIHLSQASTFYTSGRVRGAYSIDGGRTFTDFYLPPPFRGKSFSSARSVDLPSLNSTNVLIRYLLQRYAGADYKVQFLRDCDDGPAALEITGSVRQQPRGGSTP